MGATDEIETYDLICLGSGEAGKYIAWTYAGTQGKRCAVIEREWLGGSCPNVACLPSKNVIHSAKFAQLAAHGDSFGLKAQSNAKGEVNMHAVKQRKEDMIDGLMDLHRANFEKNKVYLIWGDGKFVGPKTISVKNPEGKERLLKADKIVICTGSRAAISEVPGLKEADPLTHVEMLNIEDVPDHLIIIGAGYVGLEFAQAMRRFGSKVTVVDRNSRILKKEDEDVATLIQKTLEKEGITICTDTTLREVSGTSGKNVLLKGGGSCLVSEIKGSHILCATGRIPNTEGGGLETAGVKLTKHGHVEVDELNQTCVDGVFAVGDCAGSPYFTHIGFDDFRIVRDVLNGKTSTTPRRSNRQVPFTLFTDPELAHVGLREHEAKAKGIQYRLTKVPMAAFLRTRTLGETDGFAKALISAEDDTILGFTAVGSGVGELLPVVQLAMKKGLPYTDIAELIITHPTLSEGLVALFSAVPPRS